MFVMWTILLFLATLLWPGENICQENAQGPLSRLTVKIKCDFDDNLKKLIPSELRIVVATVGGPTSAPRSKGILYIVQTRGDSIDIEDPRGEIDLHFSIDNDYLSGSNTLPWKDLLNDRLVEIEVGLTTAGHQLLRGERLQRIGNAIRLRIFGLETTGPQARNTLYIEVLNRSDVAKYLAGKSELKRNMCTVPAPPDLSIAESEILATTNVPGDTARVVLREAENRSGVINLYFSKRGKVPERQLRIIPLDIDQGSIIPDVSLNWHGDPGPPIQDDIDDNMFTITFPDTIIGQNFMCKIGKWSYRKVAPFDIYVSDTDQTRYVNMQKKLLKRFFDNKWTLYTSVAVAPAGFLAGYLFDREINHRYKQYSEVPYGYPLEAEKRWQSVRVSELKREISLALAVGATITLINILWIW